MSLVLILFLLLAVTPESAAVFPENSSGLNFVVVFPENIAFYHPVQPQNQVQVTALFDDTRVTVTPSKTEPKTLKAAETHVFQIDAQMALREKSSCNKAVKISSTKNIVVHVINHRNNSLQTALLMPTDKLATQYLIPALPTTSGTTERRFKIIVVNMEKENSVTLSDEPSRASAGPMKLQPYHNAQFWVTEQEALKMQTVKATEPVAVFFVHPCVIKYNCTCGMLYTVLPPAQEDTLKFFIPPDLIKDAERETYVLLTKKGSSSKVLLNPESLLVQVSGTAILYRPGLLINLIPEQDFASCFTISAIAGMENFAVIVVHKDHKDGVRLGKTRLQNPTWQEVKGTEHVSTKAALASGTNIIWHTSFKVAVYFVGKKDRTLFGNPAAIVSKNPDFRGCTITEEILEIGDQADGWRESLKYCKDKNLDLISIHTAEFQEQINKKLIRINSKKKKAWISFRLSSLNGQWYWLSKEPVTDTNWEKDEPGLMKDGQCAMMSLETSKNFGWRNEDCCKAAHPMCYKEPDFLPYPDPDADAGGPYP